MFIFNKNKSCCYLRLKEFMGLGNWDEGKVFDDFRRAGCGIARGFTDNYIHICGGVGLANVCNVQYDIFV